MTLLLCPECCQWREPVDGRCLVCSTTLDLAIPDPSLEAIAEEIGDLQGLLGESHVSRPDLPKQGRLYATTNGLLFVPNQSRVIVFENPDRARAMTRTVWPRRWIVRWWSRLSGRDLADRFACEQRVSESVPGDRIGLAELLRSHPGILFWSRRAIVSWRRQHGQWVLLRRDDHGWPERISMCDRDGDRALQSWLEMTACPLPMNVL